MGKQSPSHDTIVTDVAIVGAGVAGLYTAWRLLQDEPKRSIHILERLPRTGGRLETDHVLIDGARVKTEEGGMRFMDSQVELMALLEQLDLKKDIVPFPMGDDHNLYYLRGTRFTLGDAKRDPAIWSRLYSLNESAKGIQPGKVLQDLLNAILEENHIDPKRWKPTPDEWTNFRMKYTYKGIPTYKWGFWAMLTDFGLSPDCIEMLYQSSGFIAPYDQEVNAGCALQLLVDFVHPKFHTLGPGYHALPDKLGEEITQKGAVIHLEHQVVTMEERDGRLMVVTRGPEEKVTRFLATDVIFAVTQLALRELIPFVPMFRDQTFMADVDSLTDMELGKINLYYDHNWWTPKTGIQSGGSYTDLPMAQFYCFSHPKGNDPNGPASITLYTDYYRTEYWAQLQELGEPYEVPNGPTVPAWSERASTFVVEQATRQMKEMFGLGEIPAPLVATYRRWGVPSAGDGDHQWRIGVNDVEVRSRMANPFPHVYTCGESYSDDQAWVNGALRSVDQMLPLIGKKRQVKFSLLVSDKTEASHSDLP